MSRKFFVSVFILLLVVEFLSWIVFGNTSWTEFVFVLVVLFVGCASLYKLEYGIYAILGELVIGSQGHMFDYIVGGFAVSIRLGMFLAVMAAWLVWVIRERKIYFFQSRYWKLYVALWTFLVIGVLVGYLFNNDLNNIFFDWNGYLFFGLLLPFSQAIRTKQHIYKAITVVVAGVTVLAVQTVLILFIFSHNEIFQYYLPSIYKWIRDLRIGEITLQGNGFYRIFFQSHIYIVYILFISLGLLVQRYRWTYLTMLGVSTTLLFLSYSRSFWVATIAALGVLAIYLLWKYKMRFLDITKLYAALLAVLCAGYLGALLIVNVPVGGGGAGVDASSLITDRTQDPTTEAAGSSRMALLKPLLTKNLEHPLLGSGFGSVVTYATSDPRALVDHPDGLYTTYAFEWGYLDLWLKLGVAGTGTYILLVVLLIMRSYQYVQRAQAGIDRALMLGVSFGIIALGFIHALTPYLNHPLGIAWIIMLTCMIDVYTKKV